MIEKKLDICVQNDNIDSLVTALPLSIVLSDPNLLPWFYENYVEIYSLTTEKLIQITYNDMLTYENNIISPIQIKSIPIKSISDDIVKKLEHCIQMNRYIIVFVDEYYMKNSKAYLQYHFNHEYLIYGYSQNNKSFLSLAFSGATFTKINLSYDDISKAFKSSMNMTKRDDFDDKELYMVRLKKSLKPYPFQISNFKAKINKYLTSTIDLSDIFFKIDDYDYKLGLSVYDSIIAHIDLYCMDKHEYSYNSIHAFYEHKKGILNRLIYINKIDNNLELNHVISEYTSFFDEINIVRMLYIKLNYISIKKSKIDLSNKLKHNLLKCKELEYSLLAKVLISL